MLEDTSGLADGGLRREGGEECGEARTASEEDEEEGEGGSRGFDRRERADVGMTVAGYPRF